VLFLVPGFRRDDVWTLASVTGANPAGNFLNRPQTDIFDADEIFCHRRKSFIHKSEEICYIENNNG